MSTGEDHYSHSPVLVKPRVLIAVSGSSVFAEDVEDELEAAQGYLFQVGRTMAHLGTDQFELQELINSNRGFELLHIVADAQEKLALDGQEVWAEDFAAAIAGSDCRFVLITGECGDLVVSSLWQALVEVNHDCAILGIPLGIELERRQAFVAGFYKELARFAQNNEDADPWDLALAAKQAMEGTR